MPSTHPHAATTFAQAGKTAPGHKTDNASIHADLHHRHIGLRKDLEQHAPRTVIEAALVVEFDLERRQPVADRFRKRRAPRRLVLHFIHGAGEAAEIMDRWRRLPGRDLDAARVPVCGNADDTFRLAELAADGLPCPGDEIILHHIARATVAEEDRGLHPALAFLN